MSIPLVVILSGTPGCNQCLKELNTTYNEQSTTMTTKFSPDHYQRGIYEVWDIIHDQQLDYFLGNVVKYVCRAGHKSNEEEVDDLRKAVVYLKKKIEILSKQNTFTDYSPELYEEIVEDEKNLMPDDVYEEFKAKIPTRY